MTPDRNPRTGRPDDLIGKRVALTHVMTKKGKYWLDAGARCLVLGHLNGYFSLQTLDQVESFVFRARRADFAVNS